MSQKLYDVFMFDAELEAWVQLANAVTRKVADKLVKKAVKTGAADISVETAAPA